MYLKHFPKDVDVGELVDLVMTMTQSALLRVYEIVELEKRQLTEDERKSLDVMMDYFDIAKSDAGQLKKKSTH